MVLSLWSVTMLSLYIRVQVNVLGRHLYIDTARGLTTSHLLVSHFTDLNIHFIIFIFRLCVYFVFHRKS